MDLTDSGKSSTDSDNSEDSAPTDDTDSDEENHEELRNIRGKGSPHASILGETFDVGPSLFEPRKSSVC